MLSYIKKYHKSGLFATKFSKQKDNSSSCMYNVTIIHVNKLHICGLYIYIALNLKDTCISEASNFIFVLRLKKKFGSLNKKGNNSSFRYWLALVYVSYFPLLTATCNTRPTLKILILCHFKTLSYLLWLITKIRALSIAKKCINYSS